jgi:hypothetical protein
LEEQYSIDDLSLSKQTTQYKLLGGGREGSQVQLLVLNKLNFHYEREKIRKKELETVEFL